MAIKSTEIWREQDQRWEQHVWEQREKMQKNQNWRMKKRDGNSQRNAKREIANAGDNKDYKDNEL